MKITVEKTPKSEAVLEVELDWEEVEKASDRAYRKLAQKYTVPGFRRGHAPRTMLERMIGKEAIYQEGLDDLIDQSYKQALSEHRLTPIGQADVDVQPLEPGQPYHFKATIPILSPADPGDYRSLHFDQPEITVTDEDIDKVLANYQEQQAIWVPVERPAQLGDRVTANLTLLVGERTVSDLKDHEFTLSGESAGLFAGMDEQIVGMVEGETKAFTTTISEEYANKELAGKEANYTVTIKAVKTKELPPIDDELAKGAGKYQTLDELRESLREQLLTSRTNQAKRDLEAKVLDAATEQANVELHHLLVEEEADSLYHQMEHMLQQQHMSMEQFLMLSQKTPDQYKKELEPEAERQAKTDLVLEAIADKEGITVSERELQSVLDLYARLGASKPQRVGQLSASGRRRLEASLKRDKARSFLIEHATRPLIETEEAGAAASASDEAAASGPSETPEETGAADETAASTSPETPEESGANV